MALAKITACAKSPPCLICNPRHNSENKRSRITKMAIDTASHYQDRNGPDAVPASSLKVELERDWFGRRVIRELAGSLQDVVGLEEAAGYISVVGTALGEHINDSYRNAYAVDRLSRHQVTDVLVDLKRRIQGDFYVIEETEDKIVLGNRACPFGEMVRDRPSLCMMTSNVFGHIAAQNLGYAAVNLERTIASGHRDCRVVVYLRAADDTPMSAREYFER
jgi:hypothetical protein